MKKFRSSEGYSMIELTMAIAIGAIMILIVGATGDYMLTARRTLKQNASTIQLVHLSRILLADRQTCTENLRDLRLTTSEPAGTVVNRLNERAPAGGTPPARIASAGTPSSEGFEVTEMRIVPRSQVSYDRMLADFKFKMTMERVIGSKTKEQVFPILARVVGDRIVECMAIEPETESLNRGDICLLVTGTRRYDPATGKCSNPDVRCFTGTHSAATCGAGYALMQGWDACRAQMPSGFVDTTPQYSASYGGVSVPWSAPPSLGTPTGANSCSCDYAVDAPSTVSGALCEACCVSTTDP